MGSPCAEIQNSGLTGDQPKLRIFLTRRDTGPLGLPSGAGLSTSSVQAGGTTSSIPGFWANFFIHPPMMLE
eukprot:16242046-Heterocapsa_arctica.AAC.1